MPVPSELLDATSDGLLTLTADGRITYANARAAALLGVAATQLVGRPVRGFIAEDSPGRPEFSGRESSRAPLETKLRSHDGSARWVLVTESLVGRADQEVLVTLTDHTRYREFEEFLRQAQKFEALGRLAGGIAHDFNNLITTMYGSCDLLQARLSEADHAAHVYVEDLRRSAQRAGELSHQLLAFSRQQRLEPRPVSLDAIVRDTERMLIRIIGEDVQLIVLASAPAARVHADPGQISQVLLNLAANARDAMPHGGTLTIETRTITLLEPPQEPQALPPGRYVSMIVTDTGLGIAPDVLPHIFEPFYTTKGEAGTGLGLATVFGIARQSNGDILVKSGVHGTSFELLLPLIEYPAGV
jgi:two-component system cell cycle sensor histidine kinase/response regulator CckA